MRNGLRKKDLVLIAVILCVAGLTVLVHRFVGGVGANRVIVKIEGAIEGIYSLSEDREGRTAFRLRTARRLWLGQTVRISSVFTRSRYH